MTEHDRVSDVAHRPYVWRHPILLPVLLAIIAGGCDRPPVQRGLYYWGHEVNVVCPCGSTDCFWVRGEPDVLGPLRTDVQKQITEPYQPVFLTYRGERLNEPTSGFAVNYEGYQAISEVLSVSVGLPENCTPP
jgi:hypothetical protein